MSIRVKADKFYTLDNHILQEVQDNPYLIKTNTFFTVRKNAEKQPTPPWSDHISNTELPSGTRSKNRTSQNWNVCKETPSDS